MKVYRIVQDKARTSDLSGTGSYRFGGRWNSKGTYMLYTSENSSLALLEIAMNYDSGNIPPELFLMEMEIEDDSLIFTLPEDQYSDQWLKLSLLENQVQGDGWMAERKWLGIRVKSAINIREYNILLNPLYSGYQNLVRLKSVAALPVDERLIKLVNK